ncbi:hypothetical protein HYFRA_00008981 [Hymenoscyphus fraxineus]|uniref:Uncharacterized protein n=1 Tax=Hymenoscyphus fraxineus TaxID=746836 RepID=A0A9N9KWF1_9HELO|nr:hypothetical protein HYFRA_00008981 [Hymenoscyphus fraxineus]
MEFGKHEPGLADVMAGGFVQPHEAQMNCRIGIAKVLSFWSIPSTQSLSPICRFHSLPKEVQKSMIHRFEIRVMEKYIHGLNAVLIGQLDTSQVLNGAGIALSSAEGNP